MLCKLFYIPFSPILAQISFIPISLYLSLYSQIKLFSKLYSLLRISLHYGNGKNCPATPTLRMIQKSSSAGLHAAPVTGNIGTCVCTRVFTHSISGLYSFKILGIFCFVNITKNFINSLANLHLFWRKYFYSTGSIQQNCRQ